MNPLQKIIKENNTKPEWEKELREEWKEFFIEYHKRTGGFIDHVDFADWWLSKMSLQEKKLVEEVDKMKSKGWIHDPISKADVIEIIKEK